MNQVASPITCAKCGLPISGAMYRGKIRWTHDVPIGKLNGHRAVMGVITYHKEATIW